MNEPMLFGGYALEDRRVSRPKGVPRAHRKLFLSVVLGIGPATNTSGTGDCGLEFELPLFQAPAQISG